jgi:hypothetical protein
LQLYGFSAKLPTIKAALTITGRGVITLPTQFRKTLGTCGSVPTYVQKRL